MWLVALGFAVLVSFGALYETWALRVNADLTITQLIKRYTHLAIILGVGGC